MPLSKAIPNLGSNPWIWPPRSKRPMRKEIGNRFDGEVSPDGGQEGFQFVPEQGQGDRVRRDRFLLLKIRKWRGIPRVEMGAYFRSVISLPAPQSLMAPQVLSHRVSDEKSQWEAEFPLDEPEAAQFRHVFHPCGLLRILPGKETFFLDIYGDDELQRSLSASILLDWFAGEGFSRYPCFSLISQ